MLGSNEENDILCGTLKLMIIIFWNMFQTALSYACSSGNVMIIDELSKLRRLDPNLGDNENNTPLHYAAQAGINETTHLRPLWEYHYC